jgi:hypothetical protein
MRIRICVYLSYLSMHLLLNCECWICSVFKIWVCFGIFDDNDWSGRSDKICSVFELFSSVLNIEFLV